MIWDGLGHGFQPGEIRILGDRILEETLPGSSVRSLRGCWAIPAFSDCHVHLVNFAMSLSILHLEGMPLQTIRKELAGAIASIPRGMWVRGRGWEAAVRLEGGFPDRREIDDMTPDHPVALSSKDGHTLWLNSLALDRLELDDSVTDPPGGRFERRTDGSLTGIVRETAMDHVLTLIPPMPVDKKRGLVKKAIQRLLSQGIVAVHTFESLKEFDLLADMSAKGELPLHVTASFNIEDLDEAIRRRLRSGDDVDGVRVGGLKLFADGALGSRTAAVSVPYSGEKDNYGMDVMDLQEIKRVAVRAAKAGLATAVHAIGDRAVNHSLLALTAAVASAPGLRGFRVEHIQLIQPCDLKILANQPIYASIQPCHMIADIEMAEKYWTNQTGLPYAYGSMKKNGAKLVFGTDAPIEHENPLWNIDAAVTRCRPTEESARTGWHPGERMDVIDAFRAATSVPPELEQGSGRRGLLKAGYPADIVILDRNPFEAENRPGEIRILETLRAGQPVTSSGEL